MGVWRELKDAQNYQTMKLLRLICLGLFAGQARGAACPLGVVGDFFNEVAGVDKSFHRRLPTDTSKWGKLICGVLKLAQSTVDVTLRKSPRVVAAGHAATIGSSAPVRLLAKF